MNTQKAVLFWSNYPEKGESLEKWKNKPLQWSQLHKLSISSYAKFCSEATIYTYQKARQLPFENVKVCDASEFYPAEKAFKALSSGHSLAHVSDIVRLRAASEIEGIVLDMDAVLLKPLPDIPLFFSSMPAKLLGGFAPKWGKSHPPMFVPDKSWDGKALSAFPVKVNRQIKGSIAVLVSRIEKNLEAPPQTGTKAWNYIMWELKRIASFHPTCKVFPPIAFCPIPAWLGSGKCYSLQVPTKFDGKQALFGYVFPSTKQIFSESYAIQHFFESSFKESAKAGENFWHQLPDNCLLGMTATHVLGSNWKNFFSLLLHKENPPETPKPKIKEQPMKETANFKSEQVNINTLKPHPRNYRAHPDDQLNHIIESIKTNGFYRNIVVSSDDIILAGHGVVLAARKMGIEEIPIVRVQFSSTDAKALKLLTGDNEISKLGEVDDRLLTELLKEIKDADAEGLLGTGYDEKMLANLLFITRPEGEIKNFSEAAEWVGMPEYQAENENYTIHVQLEDEKARDDFLKFVGVKTITKTLRNGKYLSFWWPDKERNDRSSLRFTDEV